MTISTTIASRSTFAFSDVRSVESCSGSIGKISAAVYTEVVLCRACWSMAEPGFTSASTSATATRILTASPARLVSQIPVGNVPNSVVVRGNYAYVSNEGGRPATNADFTNYSDGTPIVVDRKDAFTLTGTVSVVNLTQGKEEKTISVGLHPAGMTIFGSNLYVANAYSDSLSVIDLKTDKVVRTIDLSVPIAGGVFGSGPNGVAVTGEGKAYVTLGQANAVAVINLQTRDAHPVIGYIPTAYFPTSISYDTAQKQLVVADDKGLGAREIANMKDGIPHYNTHADMGVVNLIPEPNAGELAKLSKQVFDNNHWNLTTNIEVGNTQAVLDGDLDGFITASLKQGV